MWIHPIPLAARATPITPENKSTAVTIATWLLMAVFVIMFLSREATKFVVVRKFNVDDVLIFLATVLAVGLSVTALILAGQGLGVLGDLTVRRANALMKGYYASDFLYIASLCFAKLSLIAFFYSIIVQRVLRRVVQALGIFVTVWTSASLIAVGLQCGLPRPWEMMTLHCYNRGLFWIVYCIIDMTTDVAIIMLSVNLVAYLKVKLSRKVMVVACFAPRLLVIGAALARLIYLYPIDPHDNPQFNLWIPVICTQVQVCLSISTACIPYMKPFFEGVGAGVWRVDDVRRKGMTAADMYVYGSESGYMKAHKKGKEVYSMDSTSLKYGRTPDVSPRIPSPAPLSPLTAPKYNSSSSPSSSRSPSERGLRLHIPPPETQTSPATDVTSPQTASSIALSPNCLSPQPLLSPPRLSPNRGPSPPPRSHSPRPLVSSLHYGSPSPNSSPDPTLLSPPRTPNPTAFPQPPSTSPGRGRYSLIPQVYPTPPPIIPRPMGQNRKRISMHRMPANSSQPPVSKAQFPPRSSSRQRSSATPKYGVAPDPLNPSPSATIQSYAKTRPTQRTGTPPPIPSYHTKTPPTSNPPTFPPAALPSSQRTRNQRILSPQNSSRKEHISPVSPASPPTPMTFWREDTSSSSGGAPSAGSAMRAQSPWEADEMPVVRDVRGSPKIVIQRFDS